MRILPATSVINGKRHDMIINPEGVQQAIFSGDARLKPRLKLQTVGLIQFKMKVTQQKQKEQLDTLNKFNCNTNHY